MLQPAKLWLIATLAYLTFVHMWGAIKTVVTCPFTLLILQTEQLPMQGGHSPVIRWSSNKLVQG